MSPVQSSMVWYARPSFSSTIWALATMWSCSAADCSGVAIETSSTFWNWCWRIMPRVSRPADPASERKQWVRAVSRSGRSSSEVIASRTRLVRDTSAVGMR